MKGNQNRKKGWGNIPKKDLGRALKKDLRKKKVQAPKEGAGSIK
jgi:hypothetical protein